MSGSLASDCSIKDPQRHSNPGRPGRSRTGGRAIRWRCGPAWDAGCRRHTARVDGTALRSDWSRARVVPMTPGRALALLLLIPLLLDAGVAEGKKRRRARGARAIPALTHEGLPNVQAASALMIDLD